MHRKLDLWPHAVAPYSEFSPEQAQPSVTEYAAPGARCAMVVCPGGGYTHKAPHEGGPIAEMLAASGISAYVLDYRVMPCHCEAPLSDALRAIRLVRSLGYRQVGIMGFSAGGHLTCSAATLYTEGDPSAEDPIERLSARPDVFVPCYAVVSFASFRHQGSLESLLGERANDYDFIRRFSAELHVDSHTPPAFLWHTASDEVVPVEQSLMLAQALSHAMIPFELHVFPQGHHGLGLAADDPVVGQWPKLLCDWLHGRGF
ncbi:MAG: alpha/beta hydrolase [Clostridia bacterium]|nr:alpha/beta hydrolase [Clostridia bacterium]